MNTTELLTQQFYEWERRGRGWNVWPEPVELEPPFRPFLGHFLPRRELVDDGQMESGLSGLATAFLGLSAKPKAALPPPLPEEEEPEPERASDLDELVELQVLLPPDLDVSTDEFEHCLRSLAMCREPVAFELIGQPGQIISQFVASAQDANPVRRQLQTFFPGAAFLPKPPLLQSAWENLGDTETVIVEFGLANEFMQPLASVSVDPYIGITGALSELRADELAVFQILFAPVRYPWAESVMRAVLDNEGGPFFANAPELVAQAKHKVSCPLYAAVVRLATKASDFDRALEIARDVAGALRVFGDPAGNELIPLTNDDYAFPDHETDLLRRQSRRSGMLFNSEELTGFVHLPSAEVTTPALRRLAGKTKAAPKIIQAREGLLLGSNLHAGTEIEVRLIPDQRVRHAHLIGASGTGKSTLLFNLIHQSIDAGEGLAVLDPHGDLIDRILGSIPGERFDDVILFDPSDEEFSIGFNVLSAHSDLEKNLLASDLVSVFQRLSTSWGDQMGSVLQNAILAFLESSRGGTLADLRRFLLDTQFRNDFLQSVNDPDIVYYWRKAFPQLSGNKSIGPVLTRLDTFLAPKPIRYMVSQPVNRLDFRDIMDTGKILLAKLSQGQIGKENAFLLGSLLMAKFQQTAMSRQAQNIASRKLFSLVLDEFHNFITPSLAEILTGARKYRVSLVLAHQELRQLERDREVASAVLSNCYTRVVFRVSDDDARKLSEGFATFEARDIQNLATGQAICRVERSDNDFNLTIQLPEEPDELEAAARRREIITASRKKYGTPRAEVESLLRARAEPLPVEKPPASPPKIAEPLAPPPPVAPVREPKPVVPSVSELQPVVLPEALRPQPSEVLKPKSLEKEPPPVEAPKLEPPPVAPAREQKPAVSSVSEPKPVVAPPAVEPEPILPIKPSEVLKVAPEKQAAVRVSPPDKGIGGNQHNLIRERIEIVARELGYSASREHPAGERDKVDLVLEKANRIIACEIAITTTIDHEVGNVAKCLKADYPNVFVISPSEDRLEKIKQAVQGCVPADQSARVSFHTPEQFLAHLRELAVQDTQAPTTPKLTATQYGKYKVKTTHVQLTPEERKQREAAALDMLTEALRTKP